MDLRKYFLPSMLLLLPGFSAATGVEVTASHRLIGATDFGDSTQSSFEVTLTNDGLAHLYSLYLVPSEPMLLHEPDTNAMLLDVLPAGGSVVMQWVVDTPIPMEIMLRGQPILFDGEATDSAGLSTNFPVVSEQEVQP